MPRSVQPAIKHWTLFFLMRDFALCVPHFAVHQTVCKNTLANSIISIQLTVWTVPNGTRMISRNRQKRREKSKHTHRQTKTKITRESTMNVPIKKITNVNNNRISGRALRFRLDMCECWEFKRKRAHCTVHTQTPYSLPIIVAFVWQSYAKSAMWRNLVHTFATVKFLFAKKYGT